MAIPETFIYIFLVLLILSVIIVISICCDIICQRSVPEQVPVPKKLPRLDLHGCSVKKLPELDLHGYSGKELPELDLHGYRVQEALAVTENFLASHRGQRVRIITGRGRHNPSGKAPIKSAVLGELRNRRLCFKYANEGCLLVDV